VCVCPSVYRGDTKVGLLSCNREVAGSTQTLTLLRNDIITQIAYSHAQLIVPGPTPPKVNNSLVASARIANGLIAVKPRIVQFC